MCNICCWVWGYFWTVMPKFPRLTLYKHNFREQSCHIIALWKQFVSKPDRSCLPFSFLCLLLSLVEFSAFLFHSCPFSGLAAIITQITCQTVSLNPFMAFNNPPGHTEEELWQQILSLSRELQECRACLHYHNTLDYIYDKINMIEKELDILLRML